MSLQLLPNSPQDTNEEPENVSWYLMHCPDCSKDFSVKVEDADSIETEVKCPFCGGSSVYSQDTRKINKVCCYDR